MPNFTIYGIFMEYVLLPEIPADFIAIGLEKHLCYFLITLKSDNLLKLLCE